MQNAREWACRAGRRASHLERTSMLLGPCVPPGALVPLKMGRTRSVVFHTTQYYLDVEPRVISASGQETRYEGEQPSAAAPPSGTKASEALHGRSNLDEKWRPINCTYQTPFCSHPHHSVSNLVSPLRFDDCAILLSPSLPIPSTSRQLAAAVLPPPFTYFPGPC